MGGNDSFRPKFNIELADSLTQIALASVIASAKEGVAFLQAHPSPSHPHLVIHEKNNAIPSSAAMEGDGSMIPLLERWDAWQSQMTSPNILAIAAAPSAEAPLGQKLDLHTDAWVVVMNQANSCRCEEGGGKGTHT